MQGDVSTQRGDTGDWAAAALNQPLVVGDRISTGDNSRAELQLDHANVLRLGNNSQVKIATVERVQYQRAQIQVQIGQGLPTTRSSRIPRPKSRSTHLMRPSGRPPRMASTASR
ncbi:MAG: hypothetical protein DMG76_34545 [Acidobacteria bacterium]|nr:MAG: hypothetical protein DMG76_34545 [Acidobacteriota bacterium]